MEEATTEEKFHTAVQLIKNLPKTGSFQPSNDLKLKFYSYYKQATEGPCELPKPSFWDIISRAKWDAWKGLGTMSKEDAMQHYINAFVEILQTAPYDDSVNPLIDMLGPFIEYAPKELRPLEMNGSKGLDEDSDHSPIHASSEIVENVQMANAVVKQLKGKDIDCDSSDHSDQTPEDIQPCAAAVNGHNLNGSNESDSEEFSDTFDKVNENDSDDPIDVSCATVVEEIIQNPVIYNAKGANVVHVRGGGDQRSGSRDSNSPVPSASGGRTNRLPRHGRGSDGSSQNPLNANVSGGAGGSRRNGGQMIIEPSVDVNEQLALAVIRLQHTMEQVVSRLDSLEVLLQERKSNPCIQVSKMKNSLWSVFGLSTRAALLILVWPFVAHWVIYVIQKRRRR